MKKVSHSKKVDLSGWNLGSIDVQKEIISREILKCATEAVQLAMDDSETCASFPAIWGDSDGYGGKKPKDPLTLYFTVAAGSDSDNLPKWKTSLNEILKDDIRQCAEDGSYADGLAQIRDGLIELAKKIDAAIKKGI